ncbi:MAG: UDP-glucose 4-epimerase GalE [Sphingomonadales bacterium]|nr:UDP-glucose 4-epimerase GalE [Sphingomonadales bacterium]
MGRILVTGGSGYIGSHTVVALLEAGYEVVSIDDHSRSHDFIMDRIKQITGTEVVNHRINLVDRATLEDFFCNEHTGITGVIHFAAYKAVGESVANPLLYFENNLVGQINLMRCVDQYNIPHFVFSSSCTVYGNPESLPVTESSPLLEPESPYGRTKLIGEAFLRDWVLVCPTRVAALRYFNPVGAHPSALIGEFSRGVPENLLPYITQTAAGIRERLTIYGRDYPTRDGTCVRDYLHVCDVALAHVAALKHLERHTDAPPFDVFNLGSGVGQTVLEMVQAFEEVTGTPLTYTFGERRTGDVVAVYADNRKAREQLGWSTLYSLQDMLRTAWAWEQALSQSHNTRQ